MQNWVFHFGWTQDANVENSGSMAREEGASSRARPSSSALALGLCHQNTSTPSHERADLWDMILCEDATPQRTHPEVTCFD